MVRGKSLEVRKVLGIGTVSGNAGRAQVEMQSTRVVVVMANRNAEVIMTCGIRTAVTIDIITLLSVNEASTEITPVVAKVTMMLEKVLEAAMRVAERIMTGETDLVAAKKVLVEAEVSLEAEMSLRSAGRITGETVSCLVVNRNLLVAGRVLVVEEVLATADQSTKLIGTDMLLPRNDLVKNV